MKTKNFLVSGFAGSIVFFLLGWLFYGILFKDFFPTTQEETTEGMVYIYLGCLSAMLLLAYIYTKWGQITTAMTGFKAGFVVGLFLAFYTNFFHYAMAGGMDFKLLLLDVLIVAIMAGISGAVIALVNGKLG